MVLEKRIISTEKMEVVIYENFVSKTFKKAFGYKKRYLAEKKALQLLNNLAGVPKIISFSDKIPSLIITRLAGDNSKKFSDKALLKLKSIISNTIKLGVARHSLPIRDILVAEKDNIGVVDFERVTIREQSWIVTWHLASLVTKYHLYNFIFRQNRKLLTSNEQRYVNTGLFFRKIFNKYQTVRDVIRNSYRSSFNVKPK